MKDSTPAPASRTEPAGRGQYPLPFGHRPSLTGDDYLVGNCNADAVAWIDRWPDWPGPALALTGAAGSGKTHLASVFAARTGAAHVTPDALVARPAAELCAAGPVIIDDAETVAGDGAAERALFHVFNHLAGRRGALLMTAVHPPARWPVVLRDLASRLNAVPVAAIGAPDDALIAGLLVKLFADRQLRVGAEVISFLVSRMDRSFAAARDVVAAIDRVALAERRAVTIPLVRGVLEAAKPSV